MRSGSFASEAQSERLRVSTGEAAETAPGRGGLLIPWWAWPACLGLDAPLVALAWLWAIGEHTGHAVSFPAMTLVGASVWLAYVADRLLDLQRIVRSAAGRGSAPRSPSPRLDALPLSRRHAFVARNRRPLGRAWVWVFGGALGLAAVELSPSTFALGVLVAVVAVAASVWSDRGSAPGALGRCLAVGAAFAGAIAVGLDAPRDPVLVVPLLGFGLVCACNVAWIAAWERDVRDGHRTAPAAHRLARRFGIVTSLAAMGWWLWTSSPLALAAMSALVAWFLLDALGPTPSSQLRTVVADLALVAPLLLLNV